jgi:hypothetical protein
MDGYGQIGVNLTQPGLLAIARSVEKELCMNAANTVENIEISQTGTDAGYVYPHCGKMEHTPNAVTLAAMREAEAIARGEAPGAVFINPAQYQTREELKKHLKQTLQS